MDVSSFDFKLPDKLIAQTPLPERTGSKLLTLNKATGEVEHRQFEDLIDYMQAGDLLVFNDTRVIPARLFGVKRETGAKVEVLLLKQLEEGRWEALVKPGKKLHEGAVIDFGVDEESEQISSVPLSAEVETVGEMGARTLKFRYEGIFQEILDRLGQMPLPPYIKKQLPREEKERYQTVYARHEGSAAAPTAGLHFTEAYMEKLQSKGIRLAFITLHVGLGTFRPVSAETVEEHEMHSEFYILSQETADLINETRAGGRKVIAVGTTSARTLETAAGIALEKATSAAGEQQGRLIQIAPVQGWTNIFIYPGYRFGIVDALLTNFHLPKSTLLMMISALAGKENVLNAYKQAVDREYRFFSFGDAMFIY